MIKYENVTFLKAPASKMSKDEFISRHINIYWLDKKAVTRKKMLGEVYDLITGITKKK